MFTLDTATAQFSAFIRKGEIEFTLTAVTFDGEEVTVTVTAANKAEAMEEAAALVPDADYIMA